MAVFRSSVAHVFVTLLALSGGVLAAFCEHRDGETPRGVTDDNLWFTRVEKCCGECREKLVQMHNCQVIPCGFRMQGVCSGDYFDPQDGKSPLRVYGQGCIYQNVCTTGICKDNACSLATAQEGHCSTKSDCGRPPRPQLRGRQMQVTAGCPMRERG